MTPEALIQLMRTCTINQIGRELVKMEKQHPEVYRAIVQFYEAAKRRKRK